MGEKKTLVGSLARHAASTAFVSAMNAASRSCSEAGTCTHTSSLPLAWRGVWGAWGAEAGSAMTSMEQLSGSREQVAPQSAGRQLGADAAARAARCHLGGFTLR